MSIHYLHSTPDEAEILRNMLSECIDNAISNTNWTLVRRTADGRTYTHEAGVEIEESDVKKITFEFVNIDTLG